MTRPPLALLALLAAAGCTVDPGATGRLALEYQVGEELMLDCRERGRRCADYLDFKREFERSTSYLTTFEASLAAHKARVAAGGAV
ncbi:hypothetical protein R5H32_15965 [Defluviimonas sp. D31]|uniref:hypothetical protein n=1 Tax=Defluviimonas sp. D31 TaxID=3083253 RepID=UPI00296EA480|nr:hypothetical protein [Defluviimonas sp. D31]MDW4550858.1 hypothetical protein [Defluviimonas sp. D31]